MSRSKRAALILGTSLLLLMPSLSLASGPPPCAPFCTPTPSPPPTPQPAPTAAPVQPPAPPTASAPPAQSARKHLAPALLGIVKLVPKRVHPGDTQKLTIFVSKAPHALVQITVRFPNSTLLRQHRLDSHGKLTIRWRVPVKTTAGKGTVTVLIRAKHIALKSPVTIPFIVLK